jgi:hypothetical protein
MKTKIAQTEKLKINILGAKTKSPAGEPAGLIWVRALDDAKTGLPAVSVADLDHGI